MQTIWLKKKTLLISILSFESFLTVFDHFKEKFNKHSQSIASNTISYTSVYIFVAFVEDNAKMSSIGYFENHVFCAKPKEVDPIKVISLQQISVLIALKYIINNNVLK